MTERARVPEREFQATIVELLDATGYATSHCYPLRTKHGWRTGNTAVGWPDLVCLRGDAIIAIEVKSDQGRPKPEQIEWLDRFAALDSGHGWLIAPHVDFQRLARWLQHPRLAPVTFGY